jgi:hypothetical protein
VTAKLRFSPFPVPVKPDDTPLVTPNGGEYRCSGCHGSVPSGAWLFETIRDGMVVGIRAQLGPDGPEVHRCGEVG